MEKLTEEAAEEAYERQRNKYSLGASMEEEARDYEDEQKFKRRNKTLDTVSTGRF